jgi:hypothetical protein
MKIRPAPAFATTALVLCGIAGLGQQSQAEIESRALVSKIVAALGGEAAVARVQSTRLKSTRHAKTADGDGVIAIDRIVEYPDRIWMLRKAPQFEATTVVTPADAFTVTAGTARDLPAAIRQEAARAIKLGVLAIAQHAQDPAYSFAVKGQENVRGLVTEVLEIGVDGDKVIWDVDPSTGRVLRETRIAIGVAGKPSQTSFEYSDWRVVDGVSVPFRIAESGSTTMVDEVISFEINPSFPPALFERPSARAGGTSAAQQKTYQSPDEWRQNSGKPPISQSCPVSILSVDSSSSAKAGLFAALVEAGSSSTYLIVKYLNASDKRITGVRFGAAYYNSVNEPFDVEDLTTPSLNLKPGKITRVIQADGGITGGQKIKVYGWVAKVSFFDGTEWSDDGSKSCYAASPQP